MGGTNGRAPIGYKNVRIEHDGPQVNSVAIDPERGPLIRTLFETYSLGDHSLATLHTPGARHGLIGPSSQGSASQTALQ
jgi:hypothetical protein